VVCLVYVCVCMYVYTHRHTYMDILVVSAGICMGGSCVHVCVCVCVETNTKISCMQDTTHSYSRLVSFLRVASCIRILQLIGSFKLKVSFAEYSLFYRALLLKRPAIPWSLSIVATP